MPRRLHQTLADYLVLAITPGLIMVMVGSLVLFLLEVFYQGNWPERLAFTLAMFVFAAVLIARISMVDGAERALPFGIALAIVVGVALNSYAEYGKNSPARFSTAVNWGLMALVWWCAHKLTWDCTLIDDSEESGGEGLLQSAGLDRGGGARPADEPTTPSEPQGVTARDANAASWWQRFVERRRQPHAHGVWVIYFSMAALPLFGLGQLCMSAASLARRQSAFRLLCLYVASGLGLLLTTSFLGLRRYLRQRGLDMPLAMASSWMGVGSALILAVLVFAALLPRPNPEYAISELPFHVGSPDQWASKHAVGKEGTQDKHAGQGSNARQPAQQQEREQQADQPAESRAQPAQPSQRNTEPSEGSKQFAGESKGSESKQTPGERKADRAEPAKDGAKEPTQDKGATGAQDVDDKTRQDRERGANQEGQNDKGEDTKGDSQSAAGKPRAREQSPAAPSPLERASSPPDQASPAQPAPTPPPGSGHLPSPPAMDFVGGLFLLFRWLFYAAVCVVAALGLWHYRHQVVEWLRGIIEQLRELWETLFGGKTHSRSKASVEFRLPPPTLKSFSEFADPFVSGLVMQASPEDLVKYSFEALEAWGREQGCARREQETPLEFARQLGVRATWISADAQRLAELYCQVAYAAGRLPPQGTEQVRQFWQSLGQATIAV